MKVLLEMHVVVLIPDDATLGVGVSGDAYYIKLADGRELHPVLDFEVEQRNVAPVLVSDLPGGFPAVAILDYDTVDFQLLGP